MFLCVFISLINVCKIMKKIDGIFTTKGNHHAFTVATCVKEDR